MGKPLRDKKTFLIISDYSDRIQTLTRLLDKHISNTVIYSASDGLTALGKIENAAPHVVIADVKLPKLSGIGLAERIIKNKNLSTIGLILIGHPPEEHKFVDEIIIGRVHFWEDSQGEKALLHDIVKCLNFSSHLEKNEYYLRFLAKDDVLMREGEKADFIFFVKKGRLLAYRESADKKVELGEISVGEFVGEMAYINGEPRSASVRALSDCELIEVPIGTFESIIYKRPSWSKALMTTLSKRLRNSNKVRA